MFARGSVKEMLRESKGMRYRIEGETLTPTDQVTSYAPQTGLQRAVQRVPTSLRSFLRRPHHAASRETVKAAMTAIEVHVARKARWH